MQGVGITDSGDLGHRMRSGRPGLAETDVHMKAKTIMVAVALAALFSAVWLTAGCELFDCNANGLECSSNDDCCSRCCVGHDNGFETLYFCEPEDHCE